MLFFCLYAGLELFIDNIKYQAGQEARIDDRDHVFQCTATNVYPNNVVITWDFGNNIVQTSQSFLTSADKGGGLVDLTSTINVVGIVVGTNNQISCFSNDSVRRRKRQLVAQVSVSVSVVVVLGK